MSRIVLLVLILVFITFHVAAPDIAHKSEITSFILKSKLADYLPFNLFNIKFTIGAFCS